MSKSQHMGFHGGKGHWGKRGIKHVSKDPSKVQTRTQSSKNMGMNYPSQGTTDGTVNTNQIVGY